MEKDLSPFLKILDDDISSHPEKLQPITMDMVDHINDLVGDIEVEEEWLDNKIDDDTTYLNSIPGMAESIKESSEIPLSKCVKIDVTKEMLGIEEKE